MRKQKLFFLGLAALLITAGFFPPSAFAFTYTPNRPPDGPSPYSATIDGSGLTPYERCGQIVTEYPLLGYWRVAESEFETYTSPEYPSTTASTDFSVPLDVGTYGPPALLCLLDLDGEPYWGEGDLLADGFNITEAPPAPAATGAITMPTGTASAFLANLSSQLSDPGLTLVIAGVVFLSMIWYIIAFIIGLFKWDKEGREIKERADRAMKKTDELLGK